MFEKMSPDKSKKSKNAPGMTFGGSELKNNSIKSPMTNEKLNTDITHMRN